MSEIRYLPLLAEFDRWQQEASTRHPGVVPCRAGCAACCVGPFDISAADVEVVLTGVAALDPVARAEVVAGAEAQVARMNELEPDWHSPFDIGAIGEARFDAVSDALAELPCPLLDRGNACRIYAHRPMICRLMGLGLVTEPGDVIDNGCPIQDDFPLYAALPPQPFPLESWEEREELAKQEAAVRLFAEPERAQYETTIAAAITIWRRDDLTATIAP